MKKIKEKTHEFICFCVSYGLWLMFWVVKVIFLLIFIYHRKLLQHLHLHFCSPSHTPTRTSFNHPFSGKSPQKMEYYSRFLKTKQKMAIFIICLCVKNILESVTGAALWCLYFLLQSGPGLRDMRLHSCLFLFTYSIIISSKISFRLLVL